MRLFVWLLLLSAAIGPCHAAVLEVGPGKPFAWPSAAIAKARDGDTVRVAPGEYEDCAVITQNRLTLDGGGGVTLHGPVCKDKALLVVTGADVTLRGLTLTNAKSTRGNGAGIRAEGARLLVENSKFINNENGILGGNDPIVSIKVADSDFTGNGQCRPECAHGIYAGHSASLRVERSKFFRQNEGHHIKSRALVTEIVDCLISDGPLGTASLLIDIPNGGTVLIEHNEMVKGSMTKNPSAAIIIAGEGETNPKGPIEIRNNHFLNRQGRTTSFVFNQGMAPVHLTANVLGGQVTSSRGEGSVEDPPAPDAPENGPAGRSR